MTRATYCRACEHAEHELLDQDLASGYSLDTVSAAYGVPRVTLWRHKKEHMFIDEERGLSIISIGDILSIPLQMKERNQLIKAVIKRVLEPLQGRPKDVGGLEKFQGGLFLGLLKLQAQDERTIMQATGILKNGEPEGAEQFDHMRARVEGYLAEVGRGDPEKAIQLRQAMAAMLDPTETYDAEFSEILELGEEEQSC